MSARPNILVFGSVWPHFQQNREAANVITHEILRQLAKSERYQLTFQYVNWSLSEVPPKGQEDLAALEQLGVSLLPPITLDARRRFAARPLNSAFNLIAGRVDKFAAGADHRRTIATQIGPAQPDLMLAIWSELAQNIISPIDIPKMAYAGNPEHKVYTANRELLALAHRPSIASRLRGRIIESTIHRAHTRVMRGFDRVLNVARNDAEEYRRFGVNADYIQNMWPSAINDNWAAIRDRTEDTKILRITGNVGNLSATGNSFGLLTIARELLPRMKARLGEGSFQIHLFGGGTPRPEIAKLLNDPHIIIRGFVDDLDAEIMKSSVFLVANNHHKFKVGHTRFLHAWSLGACCVGFDDIRLAMPEIRHNENVLLGTDSDTLVDQLVNAANSRELRRRIGAKGIETLRRDFTPEVIVSKIRHEIDALLVSQSTGTDNVGTERTT